MKLPMGVNSFIYRQFRCPNSGLKVHFGPGQRNYLNGWLNVDANALTAKIDLWANIEGRLPFRDGCVKLFYSHHVVEHIPEDLLPILFSEMYRALEDGGSIRIGVPNIGGACRRYMEGNLDWFSVFPRRYKSLGGRFSNFVFCAGEHLVAFDKTYLTELAEAAGFREVAVVIPGQPGPHTGAIAESAFLSKEPESDFEVPHTLIIEAKKTR